MKQKFIQLTAQLLNSGTPDELNNNRIVLNNFTNKENRSIRFFTEPI